MANFQFRTVRWIGLTLTCALALGGCAKWEDRARGWVASTMDVYAVMGGQLMIGEAKLVGDRRGTLTLSTGLAVEHTLRCSGSLSKTGTTAAALDLRCNDGTEMSLAAVMLVETQGYGYGLSQDGKTASITIGLDANRAISYLRAPTGQKLSALPKAPFMELK